MKTVLSVTAVLMLALSFLCAQPNPSHAETKKFNPGPITAVPVTAHPDLAITSVFAYKCLCTPNYLDELNALYMHGINVNVFNPSRVVVRDITIKATYHDLVTGGSKTLEFHHGTLLPGTTAIGMGPGHALVLAKRSVGITVSVHSSSDLNPSNNSLTITRCSPRILL